MGKVFHISQLHGVIGRLVDARPKFLTVALNFKRGGESMSDLTVDRRLWGPGARQHVLFGNVEMLQAKQQGAVMAINAHFLDDPMFRASDGSDASYFDGVEDTFVLPFTVVLGKDGELLAVYYRSSGYDGAVEDAWWLEAVRDE